MSERITIKFKDGTERVFKHQGRPGGSYTISLKLENGFAVVVDEYRNKTVFPANDIASIDEYEGSSW
jgi:hypothetical protein